MFLFTFESKISKTRFGPVPSRLQLIN